MTRSDLRESLKRIDISPLGASALAGTTFPIDRHYSAELLGFSGVYENSMDAVSDRDFVVEFLSNSALTITHLSRLAKKLFFGLVKNLTLLSWMTPLQREAALCRKRKIPIWPN